MDTIPCELLEEIFSYIPVQSKKSIFRLSSKRKIWISLFLVCKRWERVATKFFNPAYNHNRPLRYSCKANNIFAVKKLLKDKRVAPDLNMLFDACKWDNSEIVPLLASHPAVDIENYKVKLVTACINSESWKSLVSLASLSKEFAEIIFQQVWEKRPFETRYPVAFENMISQILAIQKIDQAITDKLLLCALETFHWNIALAILNTYNEIDRKRMVKNGKFEESIKSTSNTSLLLRDESFHELVKLANLINL